jgi:hypothetical protein
MATARSRVGADLRDLQRHPGAERRLRRHLVPGHPDAAARARSSTACRAAEPGVHAGARVWIEKDSLLATLMRERLSDDTLRGEQPPSPGGQGRRQRLQGGGDGARRRHRGDRGSGRALLPRRAVAPENFFRTGEFRPLFEGSSRRRRKNRGDSPAGSASWLLQRATGLLCGRRKETADSDRCVGSIARQRQLRRRGSPP